MKGFGGKSWAHFGYFPTIWERLFWWTGDGVKMDLVIFGVSSITWYGLFPNMIWLIMVDVMMNHYRLLCHSHDDENLNLGFCFLCSWFRHWQQTVSKRWQKTRRVWVPQDVMRSWRWNFGDSYFLDIWFDRW